MPASPSFMGQLYRFRLHQLPHAEAAARQRSCCFLCYRNRMNAFVSQKFRQVKCWKIITLNYPVPIKLSTLHSLQNKVSDPIKLINIDCTTVQDVSWNLGSVYFRFWQHRSCIMHAKGVNDSEDKLLHLQIHTGILKEIHYSFVRQISPS